VSTKYDKVGTHENNNVWLAQLEHISVVKLKKRERERERQRKQTSQGMMSVVRMGDILNLCDDITSLFSHTTIRCPIRRNSFYRQNKSLRSTIHLPFFLCVYCFQFGIY